MIFVNRLLYFEEFFILFDLVLNGIFDGLILRRESLEPLEANGVSKSLDGDIVWLQRSEHLGRQRKVLCTSQLFE